MTVGDNGCTCTHQVVGQVQLSTLWEASGTLGCGQSKSASPCKRPATATFSHAQSQRTSSLSLLVPTVRTVVRMSVPEVAVPVHQLDRSDSRQPYSFNNGAWPPCSPLKIQDVNPIFIFYFYFLFFAIFLSSSHSKTHVTTNQRVQVTCTYFLASVSPRQLNFPWVTQTNSLLTFQITKILQESYPGFLGSFFSSSLSRFFFSGPCPFQLRPSSISAPEPTCSPGSRMKV